MKKNTAMKKQGQKAWRRCGAAALLLCVFAQMPVAQAAGPSEAVLNFVGADIESVIKAVGHYTNMTFIIDPRVKGTVNLVSEKPVTKTQAFGLLASALRLQGFTIVIGDGFAKVVPEADAKLQAGPLQTTSGIRGDQIATQIYRLNYESAPNLVTVLRPLISPNNTINANPGNNSLIITDYADNLTRLGKIIAALDGPVSSDMDVIPIRHAIASDIAAMVGRLLEPGPGAGVERLMLMAENRTNSVIIRAPSVARANLAKSLIAKLDQPTAQPGNVHVVYLKNAEATKLAVTLRAVISSDTSAPSAAAPSSPAPSASGSISSPSPSSSGGAASQAALSSGGAAGFIQADQATNTLIITASETVYRNLRAIIDQLDSRRAQVYIESLIVEVSSEKAAEFGIQWAALSGDSNSKYRVGAATQVGPTGLAGLVDATTGGAKKTPTLSNGFSLGIFGQSGGVLTLGALAHALQTEGGTNILSTPNLITLDNEEAKIIVGSNVPFITGQYTTAASAGSAGVNPFQTVERKDVGLSLRIRPQISEGGTVKMAIYQESSSVASDTNPAGIITKKRSIETNVLVDDGQIIVLGGLIEDTGADTEEKVPGLGDLPLIGNLFKYQKRSRSKTNLMVFLRPTIIRSSEQNNSVVTDRYDYIRKAEIKALPEKSYVLPDMQTPILPTLENGRPIGDMLLKIDPSTKRNEQKATAQESGATPLAAPATAPKQ